MKKFLFLITFLLMTIDVNDQSVTGPTAAAFNQTASDITLTLSYQLDFFQCASVSAGLCVGQAATPFMSGAVIPAASVTTQAPDANGNNRTFPLTAAPASGLLAAIPIGVPFVATIIANGDPSQGAGISPRSAASNPFFSAAKPLGVVLTPRLK